MATERLAVAALRLAVDFARDPVRLAVVFADVPARLAAVPAFFAEVFAVVAARLPVAAPLDVTVLPAPLAALRAEATADLA